VRTRSREGGLRIGEMEVECNWSHGSFSFLKERLMDCSDNYRIHICDGCGMIANVNPDENIYQCKTCKHNKTFSEIRVPYAFKLMVQEINTLSVGMRFTTNTSENQ
jgi:DNA-directed RNA polymerase II subunit RPB2